MFEMLSCASGAVPSVGEERSARTATAPTGTEEPPMPTPAQYRRAEQDRAAARDLDYTADILRQVGNADGHINRRRGDLSLNLAALVEACGRHYRSLPAEVAAQALRVADAVDRATGQRRTTSG